MSVEVTEQMAIELRNITDAPLMVCRKALILANGSFDEAIEIVRKTFWRMQ